MPRFSIVTVVTRPHLVSEAIRSALAQTFTDFELVVSDNSNDGCRDLIERFADPRIRYARAADQLSVIRHWNFAFTHARGDWQILLCDDDALTPNLLEILAREIDRFPGSESFHWNVAAYFDGDYWVKGEENRLTIPAFSGASRCRDCKSLLPLLFESGYGLSGAAGTNNKGLIPFIPRAAYSERLVARIREALDGSLFLAIDPMQSAAIAALVLSEKTVHIDLPMLVLGFQLKSNGTRFEGDTPEFTKAVGDTVFEFVPFQAWHVLTTSSADTVLRMQHAFPNALGGYELSWVNFFVACYAEMEVLADQGYPCEAERRDWQRALATFPAEVQEGVRERIETRPPQTQRSGSPLVAGKMALRRFAARIGYKPSEVDQVFDTRKIGCNDIYDCAQFLGRLVGKYAVPARPATEPGQRPFAVE